MLESQEENYSVLCSVAEIDEAAKTIQAKLNGSANIFDVSFRRPFRLRWAL
jgi:hypothetical protein